MRVCACVCVWGGWEEEERRMLVQEQLFIYVAIYLNKVHFLDTLSVKNHSSRVYWHTWSYK